MKPKTRLIHFLLTCLLAVGISSCSDKDKEDISGGGVRPDGTYFNVTVDGVKMNLDVIHYARTGVTGHLAAFHHSGFPNLNVNFTANNAADIRGSYPYHMDLRAGTSIILYGIADGNGYESHYFDCPEAPMVASPGSLKIESIEKIGNDEYITGSFTVRQFQPIGICPYADIKQKQIVAEFRLKKAS